MKMADTDPFATERSTILGLEASNKDLANTKALGIWSLNSKIMTHKSLEGKYSIALIFFSKSPVV